MVTVKRRASIEVLSQFPELAQLGQERLQQLAHASVIEELPAGRLLFKPGLREDERLYLLAGEVALVSANQAMGDVAAGTEAARTALAPERPRTLWGWSKSRVQVAWVDARLLEGRATPPASAPATTAERNDAEFSAQLAEAREALQRTEAERDAAQAQVQRLERESTRLTNELTHTREQLQRLQSALASASTTAPPSAPVATPAAEIDLRPAPAEAERAGAPVPSLRIDPSERTTLAPAEIEAVLGPAPMGIATDQRSRRHH